MSRDAYGVTWDQVCREAWAWLWVMVAAYVWMLGAGVIGVPWFGVFG